MMVWGSISVMGKMRPVIIGDNLNAERDQNEILQRVAVPYLHSLGPNSVFQDENACLHTTGFIGDYLQNFGVERMEWTACSPDLNSVELLWDQPGRSVCARVTRTITLADL